MVENKKDYTIIFTNNSGVAVDFPKNNPYKGDLELNSGLIESLLNFFIELNIKIKKIFIEESKDKILEIKYSDTNKLILLSEKYELKNDKKTNEEVTKLFKKFNEFHGNITAIKNYLFETESEIIPEFLKENEENKKIKLESYKEDENYEMIIKGLYTLLDFLKGNSLDERLRKAGDKDLIIQTTEDKFFLVSKKVIEFEQNFNEFIAEIAASKTGLTLNKINDDIIFGNNLLKQIKEVYTKPPLEKEEEIKKRIKVLQKEKNLLFLADLGFIYDSEDIKDSKYYLFIKENKAVIVKYLFGKIKSSEKPYLIIKIPNMKNFIQDLKNNYKRNDKNVNKDEKELWSFIFKKIYENYYKNTNKDSLILTDMQQAAYLDYDKNGVIRSDLERLEKELISVIPESEVKLVKDNNKSECKIISIDEVKEIINYEEKKELLNSIINIKKNIISETEINNKGFFNFINYLDKKINPLFSEIIQNYLDDNEIMNHINDINSLIEKILYSDNFLQLLSEIINKKNFIREKSFNNIINERLNFVQTYGLEKERIWYDIFLNMNNLSKIKKPELIDFLKKNIYSRVNNKFLINFSKEVNNKFEKILNSLKENELKNIIIKDDNSFHSVIVELKKIKGEEKTYDTITDYPGFHKKIKQEKDFKITILTPMFVFNNCPIKEKNELTPLLNYLKTILKEKQEIEKLPYINPVIILISKNKKDTNYVQLSYYLDKLEINNFLKIDNITESNLKNKDTEPPIGLGISSYENILDYTKLPIKQLKDNTKIVNETIKKLSVNEIEKRLKEIK